MKRILCFGDSNTWGFRAEDGNRFPDDVRWTGILKKNLPGCTVIEEGLNGRTAVLDDPVAEHMSGLKYLVPCMASQAPLDLIILMLGTNDLKHRFSLNAADIARSNETLVKTIKRYAESPALKILLVCPPPLGDNMKNSPFGGYFDETSVKVSKEMAGPMKKVADAYGCGFLNAGTCSEVSTFDSTHLTAKGHAMLGEAVTKKVKEMLEI
jgi:lysophospholipase L1-like esterase